MEAGAESLSPQIQTALNFVICYAESGDPCSAEIDLPTECDRWKLEHRPGSRIQDNALASCFCIIFFRKLEANFRDDALGVSIDDFAGSICLARQYALSHLVVLALLETRIN